MKVRRSGRFVPKGPLGQLVAYVILAAALFTFPLLAQDPAAAPPAAAPSPAPAQAAAAPAAPAPASESPAATKPGQYKPMTLWDMLKSGGPVLTIIILVSIATVGMAIYFTLTITPSREIPEQFVRRAIAQITAGDLRGAYQMCEDRDELVANVLRAGLKMHGHDRYVIQEAMESEGERGATALWQRISYLNNVGVLAPLLGLLGTVASMIGAFGAIAYNDSQSKSLVMAYNVAKAMVTTAGGLSLAIVALIFYYFLRGRVVKIISMVEAQATEFVELLSKGHDA